MEQEPFTNHGGQEVDTIEDPSAPHILTTKNNDDQDNNKEQPEGEDDNNNNDDDDESSVSSVATVEADCDLTNSLPFSIFCQRVEKLWLQRSTKSDNIGTTTTTTSSGKTKMKKWTDTEKKNYILPAQMLKETLRHQSLFPLFRLLMPDIDNSRNMAIKEKLIAQIYGEALGLEKENAAYKMLYGFTDPKKAPTDCVGDLSLVVQHVMTQRIPTRPSRATLGEINQLLDDLVDLKRRLKDLKGGGASLSHQHEWRLEKKKKTTNTKGNAPPTLAKLRAQWLKRVMHQKSLSPLEHKWLVRILLQKMEFGVGWRLLLSWYNPYALELWNAHNSLKNLCSKLADENYYEERQRMEDWKRHQEQQHHPEGGARMAAANKWLPQALPATLGNTISPMLSERTTFAKCLTQLQENHQLFLKQASSFRPVPLALKFPAFCAEIKLDGERMIVHMEQQGRVTMHTRNGKWYSQLYSPCLGPALRRATSRYNIDVIFDGEIESWDNAKQELVPFGFNRTIALLRRAYLHRRGLLETIDSNLHSNADDSMRVMGAADDLRFSKTKSADDNGDATAGKDAWLQYFIFDILYVGGPDAKKLLVECGLDHHVQQEGGDGVSLVQLSALERKQVLYHLIQEQPHVVEICPTVVIRPNGEWVDGAAYFSVANPMMECGHVASRLDSTLDTIRGMSLSATTSNGDVETLEEVDRKRRGTKTDAHISRLRSQALDRFYSEVVEQHRYEGLVLKDLASPYIFGRESRKLNYWRKFKPDFEKDANVVDMDVVILGAYFASGNRHSGQISHFLCGIVDSNDTSTFMTLCNVNGKSVAYDKLDAIVSKTGFQRATQDQELQLGKWFLQDEHGDALPDFISRRSLQREKEDYDGWKFNKSKNYPDLWIHPEDSVVLTIFGQELAISPEYSAGISLRFARISKIRMEEVDGDEKSPYEIDTDETLWEIFQENIKKRRESTLAAQRSGGDAIMEGSGDNTAPGNESANYRFLTPEEYGRKPKKRKRRNVPTSPSKVPKVESKASSALRGVTVVVLEGRYGFDPCSLDAKEAQQQGWLTEAQAVKQYSDVMRFVLRHEGTISVSGETGKDDDNSSNYNTLIVGGSESDARVINYMRSINHARELNILNPKTKKDKALQKMGQTIGIVQWTFLFSVVTRWLSEKASSASGVGANGLDDQVKEGFDVFLPAGFAGPSILATHPEMLLPQKHQYLAFSHIQEKVLDTVFDPSNTEEIALIDLQRGLEEVQERLRAQENANMQTPDLKPWQYVGYQSLESELRWILAGPSSTLWPNRLAPYLPSGRLNAVVLYPDIFDGDDFGSVVEQDAIDEVMSLTERTTSERWKQVTGMSTSTGFRENRMSSCLLLARAMGAVVTPHLHGGVTHILCDLNEEDDSHYMVYDLSVMNGRRCRDPVRLQHLSSRIKVLKATHKNEPICVVSPAWVRCQWAQRIKVEA